jgi:hypothetical protein
VNNGEPASQIATTVAIRNDRLTSTPAGRNAQTAATAESVGEQAKSDFLLPFLVGPVLKRMRQVRSFVG